MKLNFFQLVGVFAFVITFAFFTFGQEKLDCVDYRYKSKEQISRAKLNQALNDKYLARFVKECFDSQYFQQAKDLLAIALEENAEHSFKIAKYYLTQFEGKKSGLMGAWSRLRLIIDRYPPFSKLDEVLFLLIKTTLYVNQLEGKNYEENLVEESKKHYKRLLTEFPFSPYVCEANKLFQQVKDK